MADAHKNFAVSAVATAPSPATSGTSLVVTAGHGSRFPAVPFNATIWPAGTVPDPTNAEIVRVTAISTDTLTITRTQESTSARTVVVGDLIAAGATAKTFTDIEITTASNILGADVALNNASNYFDGPSMAQGTAGTWDVTGTISLATGAGNVNFDVKLWDGTTVIASTRTWMGGGAFTSVTLSGHGINPVANIRMSVKSTATDCVLKFNVTGNSKDSSIFGKRIG